MKYSVLNGILNKGLYRTIQKSQQFKAILTWIKNRNLLRDQQNSLCVDLDGADFR